MTLYLQEETKDVVVGVIDNYDWDDISPWVTSLDDSGFDGFKVLITYSDFRDDRTARELIARDYVVVKASPFAVNEEPYHVCVSRFYDVVHNLLHLKNTVFKKFPINNVIMTDVKDVLFQGDPSIWLRDNFDSDNRRVVIGGEGIRYKDEPWSHNNMKLCFGEEAFEKVKNEEILCAGVIAGYWDDVFALFEDIVMYIENNAKLIHSPNGGGSDQAALNLLIRTEDFWKNYIHITSHTDGWVTHLGTTVPGIKAGNGEIGHMYYSGYSNVLDRVFETEPVLNDNGQVVNADKEIFFIVHQYNRIPNWKDKMLQNYDLRRLHALKRDKSEISLV